MKVLLAQLLQGRPALANSPVKTRYLLLIAAVLVGLTIGVGGYTFVYAKGYSYLTNDPQACANCHIMRDHYRAWTRSSHRAVAVCNDCHTPPRLVPKYVTKARNGFWHSFYFTTGRYPDPLRITPRNHDVTETTCRKCHAELTSSIDPFHMESGRGGLSCTKCHNEVGHIE
jgi:cytochrome c nitrite reductase small subunit